MTGGAVGRDAAGFTLLLAPVPALPPDGTLSVGASAAGTVSNLLLAPVAELAPGSGPVAIWARMVGAPAGWLLAPEGSSAGHAVRELDGTRHLATSGGPANLPAMAGGENPPAWSGSRRGGRAADCGGLENPSRRLSGASLAASERENGCSRVQAPAPTLLVRLLVASGARSPIPLSAPAGTVASRN
jgi:hypothetical protein